MTDRNRNSIKGVFESCFSREWIWSTARKVEYCKRFRKLNMVIFFWTLILSFGSGICRSIAEIKRSYESA